MADTRTLLDALATNLGEALGAMTGNAVRTMPTVGDAAVEWQVPVQIGGNAVGTVWLGLSQAGATQLVASILGDASLVADVVWQANDAAAGTLLGTSDPAPGQKVPVGTTVKVVLSKGPDTPEPTPQPSDPPTPEPSTEPSGTSTSAPSPSTTTRATEGS